MKITGTGRQDYLFTQCKSYWDSSYPLNQVKFRLWSDNLRYCHPIMGYSELESIVMDNRPPFIPDGLDSILSKDISPVEWLIPDFLSHGLYYIAGRKGIGKSWFVFQLSVSITNGDKFLGIYPCNAADVLYCALEDTEVRIKDRARRYQLHHPSRLKCVFMDELPRMLNGGLMMLQEHVDTNPSCKLIIIDTLAKFRSNTKSNRNLYQDDYDTIGHLQSFAMCNNISLIVVHHLNKGTNLGHEIDSISGSVGMIGPADGLYVLREHSKSFVNLLTFSRDSGKRNHAVRLNQLTLQWEHLGDAAIVSQSESRKAIYQFIIDSNKPLTMKEISDGLGKNYQTTRTLVLKMVGEGLLQEENKQYRKAETLF